MAAPDMRICARSSVLDREFAIGLFRYKSFAANKGLYPKKLPRGITRTWFLYWLSRGEEASALPRSPNV